VEEFYQLEFLYRGDFEEYVREGRVEDDRDGAWLVGKEGNGEMCLCRRVLRKPLVWLMWKATRKQIGNRVICLHSQPSAALLYDKVSWLKQNYAVVPLDAIFYEDDYPKVALTFDDDGEGTWIRNVLPVLNSLDVHGTFFVNDEGLAKRLKTGKLHYRCDIGGHTRGHVNLGKVTSEFELKKEIQPRRHFAYPYGMPDSYNPTVLRWLEGNLKVEFAWTCVPGWVHEDDYLYELCRDSLDVRDPEWYWRARLAGAYDWLYGKIHKRSW
jgi:peptidoglycan/xylan/chitin deacetylase (PgdA/CDA1 family)